MPGLRYLVCDRCETVFARPDDRRVCPRCADGRLEPLPTDAAAASYFAAGLDGDR